MNSPHLSTAEIVARLERCVAGSPAGTTEISWIELRHSAVSSRGKPTDQPSTEDTSIVIRVQEAGRSSSQRTSDRETPDLNAALRVALGQSRLEPPSPSHHLAGAAIPATHALHDAELAALSPSQAHERLSRMAQPDEILRLRWAAGRTIVVNSAGLKAAVEATAATFEAQCGTEPGGGRASASARRLDDLNLQQVIERAHRRHPTSGTLESVPDGLPKIVLAPEAAASVLDLFNRRALTSLAFSQGGADLFGGIGQSIVSPLCTLRDDGIDPLGMPFPFDLFGHQKQPLDLVARGILLTPALSVPLAAALGREPTPHEVAPDEAVASHVVLVAGEAGEGDLLRSVEDGIWISSVSAAVGLGAKGLPFRCHAHGARRIQGGQLAGPLPDLVWDDHLMAVLANILGIGDELVSVANPDGFSGATRSPALAIQATHAPRAEG
jgi:predicted Zn-dependent protease